MTAENDIVLMFADRHTGDFYTDDWDEARLYEIAYDGEKTNVTELEYPEIGITLEWLDDDVNSGDKIILEKILQYASKNYKADKIFLDLWNHGGGWKSGEQFTPKSRSVCFDEKGKKSLSLSDISSAIKDSGIGHFDIILFDACNMATIEVASELIGFTDSVIFSQKSIPEDGMPYDKIVPLLFSDSTVEEKCIAICDTYDSEYQSKKSTISSIYIDKNSLLKNFLSSLEEYFGTSVDVNFVKDNSFYAGEYTSEVIDLKFLLDESICKSFDEILICNKAYNSYGLSIFFPQYFNYSPDSWEYTQQRLNFLSYCPSYLSFLQKYQLSASDLENVDNYENNNFQSLAHEIQLDKEVTKVESYLWCSKDIDWFRVSAAERIKEVNLYSSIEFDFQVFLYKSSGLSEILYSDKNESINLNEKDFDEIFVKIYSAFGFYNQYEPYYLEIWGDIL